MGCGCSSEGHFIARYIYMFERFGTTVALTLIICCIMTTTIGMLSLGIGLGYNYCFVDFKAKRLYDGSPRGSLLRKRKSIENIAGYIEAMEEEPINIEPTMTIPLKANVNYPLLIAKIKEINKNVTLELIAT